jgi:hypothetical protein
MAGKRRTKWAVVHPKLGQYVTGHSGGIAWTHDRTEAEQIAGNAPDGMVVDAEEFAGVRGLCNAFATLHRANKVVPHAE